jgi:hypothetical protein
MKKIIPGIKHLFLPCEKNSYKPCFLESQFLFVYAIFLLILKLAVLPFLFYFPDTVFFADLTKVSLIELTNKARQECGFESLRENPKLSQAAYFKAKDMIERGYFSHNSPDGVEPWYWLEVSNYNYSSAGENLAIGFLESEQVHLAWMNSPSHQKNILNPYYQEIGIAVVKGEFRGNETALVVQFFGRSPEVVPAEKVVDLPLENDLDLKEEVMVEETTFLEEEIEEDFENLSEVIVLGEGEVISAATGEESRRTPLFLLFQFMTGNYYKIVQSIIYGSLSLFIFFLFLTVFCDFFVYKRFEIQHKNIFLRLIGFSLLWIVLVFLDKITMIELISPGEFMVF